MLVTQLLAVTNRSQLHSTVTHATVFFSLLGGVELFQISQVAGDAADVGYVGTAAGGANVIDEALVLTGTAAIYRVVYGHITHIRLAHS